MLEIPLTSFNRGINTNFETTTQEVINRLIDAVREKDVAFKTEQRFTTRYDFVQYNPGSISRLGLQTLPDGQQATAFRVVFQTDEYTQSGRFGSTPMVAIDGVNIDDWIEGSWPSSRSRSVSGVHVNASQGVRPAFIPGTTEILRRDIILRKRCWKPSMPSPPVKDESPLAGSTFP
jgi:hypothetical protein